MLLSQVQEDNAAVNYLQVDGFRKDSASFCLDEKLYFFADVPHLLKNLRSAFLNLNISLPASLVAKSNLPSHQVKHDSLSPNNKFCEHI